MAVPSGCCGDDGDDGDDGGVCIVWGVKSAVDDTDERDLSDNCGDVSGVGLLYLKYFSHVTVRPLHVITFKYGLWTSS